MNSYPQQSFSPDDENRGSIVDTLGKIALGAGTLAAGVAGYRRLKGLDTKTGRRVNTISEEDLRKPATTKTSPGDPRYDNVRRAAQGVPNITTGAIDPAPAPLSSLERYRNLEKLTRTAREERMPGTLADLSKIAQTSASAAAGLSAVPQVAKPARQTPKISSGPEQIVPQGEFNTIEIPDQVDRLIDSLGQELELNRQQRILRGIEGREIGLGKNILAGFRREAREAAEAAKNTPAKTFLASKLASEGYIDTSVTRQQANAPQVSLQSAEAVDTGIDQAVQRNKVAAQRDHDRDLSQLEVLEDIAEQNEQLMRREATPDQMIGYEPDAAVKSAIAQQPGGALRDQTDTSLGQAKQFSIEDFNRLYPEEPNPQVKVVDNARQLAELKQQQAAITGEDIDSLLGADIDSVETTLRGKALRGGKPSGSGDVVYQGAAGEFASADTGLKTRQDQGTQFKARAELLNQLRSFSDEELDFQIKRGQSALVNNENISRLDADTFRLASQVLRDRALNNLERNLEPTSLQMQALNRGRASVDASQQALQAARGQKPTLAPGPQQDVARSMETLRRGMAVDPSEPLPEVPSVQTLRTGFVEQEAVPVLGAPSVYTGAAAEAAGPVIFTGKSKANTVLTSPPIIGSVDTPTGRYLTQRNPDVLGTTYNVAGTPANRAIFSQIEQQSQDFLKDAIAGGLKQKAQSVPETYETPRFIGPAEAGPGRVPLSRTAAADPQRGPEPSQRLGYSRYYVGTEKTGSKPAGVVTGDSPTVSIDYSSMPQSDVYRPTDIGRTVPNLSANPVASPIRVLGADAAGSPRARTMSFADEEAPTRTVYRDTRTGYDYVASPLQQRLLDQAAAERAQASAPQPIGPLTQSPGLPRVGGLIEEDVQGAGGIPITQPTSEGLRIAYPRMDKPASAPGFGTSTVTNIPKYGIDPGAEDWRKDLMRNAYLRGGPVRTYKL